MAGIKYWLWLRTRHGLSNQICTRLLEQFGDPEKIYFAAPEDYLQTEGVLPRLSFPLWRTKNWTGPKPFWRIVSGWAYGSSPVLMRRIPAACEPSRCALRPVLQKGIWPDFDSEAAVALIGTQSYAYGIRIGERLGYELSKGGAYVVSGLAAGGDAAGHRGALAGARTAAVLGGGIDVVYPAENRALFEDIAVNGVLISEYPPGTDRAVPIFGTQPHYQRFKRGGDRGGSGAAQRYHEYGAACCRTRKRRLCCARPGGCAFQPRLQPSAAGGCRRRHSGLGCIARMAKAVFRTKSRWVYSMCRLRLDARRRIGKQEGMFRQSRNTRKQQLTMQKNWPILT